MVGAPPLSGYGAVGNELGVMAIPETSGAILAGKLQCLGLQSRQEIGSCVEVPEN